MSAVKYLLEQGAFVDYEGDSEVTSDWLAFKKHFALLLVGIRLSILNILGFFAAKCLTSFLFYGISQQLDFWFSFGILILICSLKAKLLYIASEGGNVDTVKYSIKNGTHIDTRTGNVVRLYHENNIHTFRSKIFHFLCYFN